jgi:hypothetical protein
MKSALTPLSSDEEIALRRIAHGSSVGPPVAARLRDLALIQRSNRGYCLTPLGQLRYDGSASSSSATVIRSSPATGVWIGFYLSSRRMMLMLPLASM